MPVKFQRKLVMIGGSLRVTVPKEIADGMGWDDGDMLTFIVTGSEVRLLREVKKR